MKTATEETALISLAKRGEHAAMKAIYSRYIGQLTAVCSRYIIDEEDVKDVLQESFLKIYASLNNFKYQGEGSLKAWMTKILVNEALKFIQRTRPTAFTPLTDDIEYAMDEDTEITDVPASVIHNFIRELPEGYRMIFNLYVIEGRSHREIAKILGISESTSASQLHRAKMNLADKIKQYLNGNTI